jgi:hypothetical protein
MPARTIVSARVIPWDEVWGVYIRFSDRRHIAYPVGSRHDAERELERIRGGSPAPVLILEPAE